MYKNNITIEIIHINKKYTVTARNIRVLKYDEDYFKRKSNNHRLYYDICANIGIVNEDGNYLCSCREERLYTYQIKSAICHIDGGHIPSMCKEQTILKKPKDLTFDFLKQIIEYKAREIIDNLFCDNMCDEIEDKMEEKLSEIIYNHYRGIES